jgi:hypothetical protein
MFIEPPPETEDITELRGWCQKVQQKLLEDDLKGSDTWNPGSIGDGNEEAKEVTVTGSALGDYAIASFSLDIADLVLDAQVTATDTVTCVLANNTGGAIDIASGTIYVRVFRRTT